MPRRPHATTVRVRHIKRSAYAGLVVDGGPALEAPSELPLHLDRAFYLAAALEAPHWGTVQSWDGAGISGGPFHFVAMLPRSSKQGPLWRLLLRLEPLGLGEPLEALWVALQEAGWFVAHDGRLREWDSGRLVSGAAIRHELAPPDGKVPRQGPERDKAERWARLFHTLLAHPDTFEAQRLFSIEWLLSDPTRQERRAYRIAGAPESLIYDQTVSPELDLALASYHAFAVNAPAIAAQCLGDALDAWERERFMSNTFARLLVWHLGRHSYGNWHVRYTRTRSAAKQMWPAALFRGSQAIMPARLGDTPPMGDVDAPPLVG